MRFKHERRIKRDLGAFEKGASFELILAVLHRAQTLVVFAAHPL